jgi:hypothetical protein
MSKSKVFLVMDCNRPGGVWAVDQDGYDWMVMNGCAPSRLTVEAAQELLTKGDRGWADFGEGEDQRWCYHEYSPLSPSAKEELEEDKRRYPEHWESRKPIEN